MTPRPDYPPFKGLPDFPAIRLLRERPQWVAWNYAWKVNPSRPDGGNWTKPPLDARTGRGASHTDARTWSAYDQAADFASSRSLPGVGYVLGSDDDIIGIDLDKCRDPSSGALESWAADIVDLGETYAEVSPSGSGVRLFAKGRIERTIKCDPAHVEIYASQRYLTVTGRKIDGAPVEVRPAPRTLAALTARVEAVKAEAEAKKRADAPKPESRPETGQAQRRGPITGQFAEYANRFFRAVNTEAMRNLDRWVPELFGSAAVYQPAKRGYRVSSSALGRSLEEDLSITPDGIVDFGVADLGDARDGKRSPTFLVMEHGGASDAGQAALWLCDRLGIDPATLGWEGRPKSAAGGAAGEPPRDDATAAAGADDARRTVRLVQGELPEAIDETEDGILAAGLPIFIRAGELVRPVADVVPAAHGKSTTVSRLRTLCTDSLGDMLARVISFQQFDGRKKDWATVNPPKALTTALLARDGAWRLPRIAGVISTPTLRPDGTVLREPGYDASTKLFLTESVGLTLPPIAEQPTRADAEQALALLAELLTAFPFVSRVDRSVALSGIVTAVLRGAMPTAPMHAIRAHTPGSRVGSSGDRQWQLWRSHGHSRDQRRPPGGPPAQRGRLSRRAARLRRRPGSPARADGCRDASPAAASPGDRERPHLRRR